MADLTSIARIPGVASAVLGDESGGFYDAVREADGESVASVTAFVAASLARTGEELGLGELRRTAVAGAQQGFVIVKLGQTFVTARVEPAAALAAVERALEAPAGKGG
jgi:predicted regulator of Ras-like GTPase activity (Roadblock/LC7/MglB family)